uniref:ICA69 domain-containing protein n=1 Tax=Loa loa TaxID=7209 RepID=A0A1I7W4Q5_LOALO
MIQEIDITQNQQQNGLSQQTSLEQALWHDAQLSQYEMKEDILSSTSNVCDNQIVKQMLTDLVTTQKWKASSDEQLTSLLQAEMSESQNSSDDDELLLK